MTNLFNVRICCMIAFCAMTGCQQKPPTLFELMPQLETGIAFNNVIEENDSFNILTHEYIYNGGGVGIADFNNDGLQDIFFSGNLVPNSLYLNKGSFTFTDVSQKSGIRAEGRWNSGVAVADINGDGWMDVYVCATMHPDSADRRNMLFINRGLKDGVPEFSDEASDYGLECGGFSVAAAFFDYDKDDDLDLYVLINQRMDHVPSNYRPKIVDGSAPNNDRLYRNNGDGTFTDVSIEAGIIIEGFGLGLSVSDLNSDGWPDIYVSNDYLSNDILYINNGNGTFSNRIADYIGHQSQFSMGNDAADFNNDGRIDIITTDMLPETNYRKKTTIGNKSYLTYINDRKFQYEHQYVRNMLHLNNGLEEGVKFSEIGQMAGVYQTEWSWSPLFADFDNDGHKDLVITNGFPKDVTDKDFANYRSMVGNIASLALLKDSIPVVQVPNYIFRNNGDLTFSDKTEDWGLNIPGFSNGAAFADLDNDGDLDYVVNNINSVASLYRNTLYDEETRPEVRDQHYVRIRLNDRTGKRSPVGAKAMLYRGDSLQYYENNIYRGFLSSVENIIHFGLGATPAVDSIVIQWSDGNVQKLVNPETDIVHEVNYVSTAEKIHEMASGSPLLEDVTSSLTVLFQHQEDDKIDFNVQRTLPHKFTQSGPALAVGDVNGDGREDIVVGGSSNYTFSVLLQKSDGTFSSQQPVRDEKKLEEDAGLLLFDADGDGDLDLYAVSGSMEHFQSREPYQDRLYLNDGKGKFSLAADAVPEITSSGSCVRAADFDADGDLDLFVGGRIVPGQYPASPESFLLQNDNGRFTDVTEAKAQELKKAGMITDAIWSDFNGDRRPDLIVVGEFTPVMFFENSGKVLKKVNTPVSGYTGWWNSIVAADFDLDGDMDYVVGNLGENNCFGVSEAYPMKVFAGDFDANGSMDAVLGCYMRESMNSPVKKLYPVHFWDEINTQSPKFRNKFSRYREYGRATMNDLLDEEERKNALVLEANFLASAMLENLGGNNFRLKKLPVAAQFAPVNGMVTGDVNGDGYPDVMMVGNDYGNEVFAGRYDAFNGLLLLGDGRGSFNVMSAAESGFYVPGDAKALVRMNAGGDDVYVSSQNRDSLRVFSGTAAHAARFSPHPLDVGAEMVFEDGRRHAIEFHHGSGYWSQSSRTVVVPHGVRELIVFDSKGQSRKEMVGHRSDL